MNVLINKKLQKKLSWSIAVQLCLCSLVATNTWAAPRNAVDGSKPLLDMVIADIDGEPITYNDLRKFVSAQGKLSPEAIKRGDFDVDKNLHQLIVEELFKKEAESLGVQVNDEDVKNYIEEIKRQNGVDDATLVRELSKQGLTLERYKRQVRGDIIRSRVISREVRGKVNVLDADIERYLQENPERAANLGVGKLHVEQLHLSSESGASEEERQDVKEEAEDLYDEVKDGKELKKASEEFYSDLGMVDEDDLRPELQKALRRLADDETSNVIETDNGFYILRVSGRRSSISALSAEAKEQLRNEIVEKKMKDEIEKFINKTLPEKFNVELKS